MKLNSWLKLGLSLAIFFSTPRLGVACICPGPEVPVSEDAPVVIGTVLSIDLADDRWKVAVWPEAARDSSRCGDYVEFESDNNSCLGRLPEIGASWAAVSTIPGEVLSFYRCSRHGLADDQATRKWLDPIESSLKRCDHPSDEILATAAEKAAKTFAASNRTCEDSVTFRVFKLTGSFVWQQPGWGEDDHTASFSYQAVTDSNQGLSATLQASSESRRKCWTRACLTSASSDDERSSDDKKPICTYLRPGSHTTSCGTLRFGTSDAPDLASGPWTLKLTEVPTAPYLGGPAYPDEIHVPERCPIVGSPTAP